MSGRIVTGAEAAEYVYAAPVSVALTKRLLWEGMHASVPDMMQRENALFAWIGNQADAREGVLSFLEKRDPDWKLSAARDLPEEF